jgi:HD-like signal output (HDOD) protein
VHKDSRGVVARRDRQVTMKRCIYVVDDEAEVTDTAVLIMRGMDSQWEVTGFKDPLEALAAVRAKAPDLILADQLMPQMQGSQLLEQVRAVSPKTIRIIMSAHAGLNKLTLITSAHQYIAKPFDTIELRRVIGRSFAAQGRLEDSDLQAVATSLRSIPSLPGTYDALLRELRNDRNATTNIARLVAQDPGLTAKVLQLANSPLFGQHYLIDSPIEAVMCLGTDMIAAVVLAQSLFHHYESVSAAAMDWRKVWSHCWHTAYLTQHVCREMKFTRIAGEEAFLAGLLHETGRFVLADNYPERFRAACQGAEKMASPLVPRLREVFRASPYQVAAYILELWGMPANAIGAIAAQDAPAADQANGFTLASVLYVADGIASRQAPPDAFALEEWDSAYLEAVGCLESIPEWEKFSTESKPDYSR